jgi:hypothetical protein
VAAQAVLVYQVKVMLVARQIMLRQVQVVAVLVA